jgi:transcriptional regulator
MQKVVGSNPISRSRKGLHLRAFSRSWTGPRARASAIFGAYCLFIVSPSYDSVLCIARHARAGGGGAAGLGELMPAHCTAGGKVLLGARSRWRASLLSRPLAAYTGRTITDPAVLEEQAAAAHARG